MAKIFNLTPTETLVTAAFFLFAYVSLWAFAAIHKKRADVADIAWGPGFFLVAWVSFLLSSFSYPSLILNLMVTLWAFRLAIHIARRNRKRKEDFRYETLKKNGKNKFRLRIFFQVFFLQGMILYIVALPILWINTHPQNIGFENLKLIFPFWLIGFLIETIADEQLLQFRKNQANEGKLLMTGLWKFVRHPNYLGEIIQWWAIWALSLNWPLLISPLLITFLIVKVSGIAPLEKKMESHPDFPNYKANTPSLVPFGIINGTVYTIGWLGIFYFGTKDSFFIALPIFFATYCIQLFLFDHYQRKTLEVSPILSIYTLFIGLLQEMILVNSRLIEYPNQGLLPPSWILCLYALFGLSLNSSLNFINRNFLLTFFLGGGGALLSYIYGERFGGLILLSQLSYLSIFISWGLYLVVVVWLNRKLNRIREKYVDPLRLENTLTVFFDQNCPVCSIEMKKLQERKQTGKIIYDCVSSQEEFEKKSVQIPYETAMKKIQAIDSNGKIFSGIDALSEIYARTDFLFIAILLQAPFFRPFFLVAYAIWAKLRRWL